MPMRLEQFLNGSADIATKTAMRLEDWLSGAGQPALQATKQAVTIPFTGGPEALNTPIYKAADAASSFVNPLGLPVSQTVQNAAQNIQHPSNIMARLTKPMTEEEIQNNAMAMGMAGRKYAKGMDGDYFETLSGKKVPLNDDGTVTLFHRTSQEKASGIEKEGFKRGLENTGEVFLSTKKEGQAKGYGDAIVEVRVNPKKINMDDAFDDEIHFTAMPRDLIVKKSVNIPKENSVQSAIEQSGGQYLGNKSGMHWYNDPVTGSTMVANDGATAEDIAKALQEKRAQFKKLDDLTK